MIFVCTRIVRSKGLRFQVASGPFVKGLRNALCAWRQPSFCHSPRHTSPPGLNLTSVALASWHLSIHTNKKCQRLLPTCISRCTAVSLGSVRAAPFAVVDFLMVAKPPYGSIMDNLSGLNVKRWLSFWFTWEWLSSFAPDAESTKTNLACFKMWLHITFVLKLPLIALCLLSFRRFHPLSHNIWIILNSCPQSRVKSNAA